MQSVAMEKHVTFIEPLEETMAQWLQRRYTSSAMMSAGSDVTYTFPAIRRSATPRKSTRMRCYGGKAGKQLLQQEASQLFERERSRLMEKPGTTAAHRHAHPPHPWGGGGGGPEGQQHTQYIRRLVDLRDELISQEETGLARALDRLRLHSINNRDAARYRLKIKDPASGESPRVGVGGAGVPGVQHSSFPRPMLTTVEKFRQMRPQKRPPVIFPLQGKQLIESSPVSTGSTTRVSTEEGSRGGGGGADPSSASSPHRGVEDTVKANLQRLVQQPTSSIPNIGRKALPRQESLELKSQSLQNIRNRVFKSTRSHLMSPFMLSPGGGGDEEGGGSRLDYSREGSSDGEFQLSPHAYKLGPMTDGDRINMDKLNQYYYVYCMPDTPPTGRRGGGGGGGEGGGPQRKSLPHSLPNPCNTPVNGHGQRRGFGGRPVAGGGGMGGGGGGSKTSRRTSSERSHLSRPFSERSSLSLVVSSDTELETSSNPRYNTTKHPSDYNPANTNERKTLPIIPDSGEGRPSPTSSSGKEPNEQAFLTQIDPSRDGDLVSTTTSEPRKRHIVIDMPHIIFNAATPDFTIEAGNKIVSQQDTHSHHHGHGHGHGRPTVSERPGVLSKTLKQNEIRHRELQNLLEDVKELNKRTETLNSQAQVPPELESSSSMLC